MRFLVVFGGLLILIGQHDRVADLLYPVAPLLCRTAGFPHLIEALVDDGQRHLVIGGGGSERIEGDPGRVNHTGRAGGAVAVDDIQKGRDGSALVRGLILPLQSLLHDAPALGRDIGIGLLDSPRHSGGDRSQKRFDEARFNLIYCRGRWLASAFIVEALERL